MHADLILFILFIFFSFAILLQYGGIVSQMDAMSVMMGQSGSHNLGMAMSSVGAFSPQLKEVITLNTCVLLPPRPGKLIVTYKILFLLVYLFVAV